VTASILFQHGGSPEILRRALKRNGDGSAAGPLGRLLDLLATPVEGAHGRERQWFVKGETQVLRLAGTLAYMAWAISLGASLSNGAEGIASALEPTAIAEQFMIAAIRLWLEFFWPHARAALRQIGLSERHANARRVLRWLKAHSKNEVSREETRREALSQSLDADQTQSLIDSLVKAGWLREITKSAGPSGGRPARRWLVNPMLFMGAQTAQIAETSHPSEFAQFPQFPQHLRGNGHTTPTRDAFQ
jgi:hypothetical protein